MNLNRLLSLFSNLLRTTGAQTQTRLTSRRHRTTSHRNLNKHNTQPTRTQQHFKPNQPPPTNSRLNARGQQYNQISRQQVSRMIKLSTNRFPQGRQLLQSRRRHQRTSIIINRLPHNNRRQPRLHLNRRIQSLPHRPRRPRFNIQITIRLNRFTGITRNRNLNNIINRFNSRLRIKR